MAIDRSTAVAAEGADLLALVELALEEARVLGASQAEAAISMDVGLSVSVRLGEVETIEYQRDRGMAVTVYFDSRKGTASTADLGAGALRETVAKACSIARFTAAHQARYGFVLPVPVESVALRHVASLPGAVAHFSRDASAAPYDEQRGIDSGGPAASTVRGPRSILLPDATAWVAAGWEAAPLAIGGWMLRRVEQA
jgi:predicted Zn-dependent protease